MHIIAMGGIHIATGEVAAIAELTSRDRLTVTLINSPFSI